jgi:hypothetical protein
MGRPLNQKYFNPVYAIPTTAEAFEAGSTVTNNGQFTLTFTNHGVGYGAATTTVTFSAPQLPGGVTATGTVTALNLDTNGNIGNVTVTNAGSGYTSAPTIAFLGANTTPAAATTSITTNSAGKVIAATAWLAGDTQARPAIIKAQKGWQRYRVQTSYGIGVCKLVGGSVASGQMQIIATDSNGNTYDVVKLTDTKAYLVQNTQNGSNAWLYGVDSSGVYNASTPAKWTITGSAVAPTSTNIGTVVISSD